MTVVLGLHGFSADNQRLLHDTGVSIVKDGRVIAAINEERLSRNKNDGCFPWRSYEKILDLASMTPDQIDIVAFADERPSWQIAHIAKYALETLHESGILPIRYLTDSLARTFDFCRVPPKEVRNKQRWFVEHHMAHAAAAYYTSPWRKCTVVTLDGMGDYCIGGTISLGIDGRLRTLKRTNGFFSPGIFYMIVTDYLGFKPGRDEGKTMGLAAYGNPRHCYESMRSIVKYRASERDFHGAPIANAINECSLTKGHKSKLEYFRRAWRNFSAEDVAAAAQARLEDVVLPLIQDALALTHQRRVALAGGVFANVKLNQRILELPCVDNIYVHPNMTDGGLATGAALYAYHNHLIRCGNPCEPSYLNTVYLGPAYNNRKIEAALRKLNVKYEKVKCTEDYVARALHSKKIVAHFFGRMEYGPRALGNRSILASPVDRNVNRMLNERLGRTEFMPFAPSILEDYADSCLAGWRYDHFASRFMTVTYNVTDYLVRLAPAVVHVDRTVRPHIVRRDDNPRFYSIIRRYFQLSAVPLVINTSFNMHGEPIVCTPEDAVRAYTRGAVDAMAIGDYWVDGE